MDGTSAGASADGLVLVDGFDGSTIRALVINNFSGVGISITSTDNTVVELIYRHERRGLGRGQHADGRRDQSGRRATRSAGPARAWVM